jgi:hypothetical protein
MFRIVFWDVSSSLMMEAVRASETSVDNHFTRQYIPEDNSEHHTLRRENLKSHMKVMFRIVFWDVSSSLMMEAVRTSETSVDNHFTRQYIPEDNSEHHTLCRENLKSHMKVMIHTFQYSAEPGGEWSAMFIPGLRHPDTRWTGNWMRPRQHRKKLTF